MITALTDKITFKRKTLVEVSIVFMRLFSIFDDPIKELWSKQMTESVIYTKNIYCNKLVLSFRSSLTRVVNKKYPFEVSLNFTVWNVSKYGVFSSPNAGKYRPEKTPYLDTFHAVFMMALVGMLGLRLSKYISRFCKPWGSPLTHSKLFCHF